MEFKSALRDRGGVARVELMRDVLMSTGWPIETRALVVSRLPRHRIAVEVGWVEAPRVGVT